MVLRDPDERRFSKSERRAVSARLEGLWQVLTTSAESKVTAQRAIVSALVSARRACANMRRQKALVRWGPLAWQATFRVLDAKLAAYDVPSIEEREARAIVEASHFDKARVAALLTSAGIPTSIAIVDKYARNVPRDA
jgi:hypothetical protein